MMIHPTINDLYRSVTRRRPGEARDGWIEAFNTCFVFVVFNGDHRATATRREDLHWSHPADGKAAPQ